jgi:hypothetical protein
MPDAAAPDRAEALLVMGDAAVSCGDGEMHETDRLARCRATRSGDAGDSDREINIGMFECAERHSDGDFLAHRAEGLELRRLNAEHRVLGFIGVGDEATIDDIGRAGHFGQRGGDKTASTGLGGCDLEFTHPAEIEEGAGQRPCGAVAHVSCSRPYSIHPPKAGGWWRLPLRQYLPDGR